MRTNKRIELLTFRLADVASGTQRLRANETVTSTTFAVRYAAQRLARAAGPVAAKGGRHGRLDRA